MFAKRGIDAGAHFLVGQSSHGMEEILVISNLTNTKQPARSSVYCQNAVPAIDDDYGYRSVAEHGFVNSAELVDFEFGLGQVKRTRYGRSRNWYASRFPPNAVWRRRRRRFVHRQAEWTSQTTIDLPLLVNQFES